MSIQVVCPATGEILMMCSDDQKDVAIKAADYCHKQDGKRYDVIQFVLLYSTDPSEQAGHA